MVSKVGQANTVLLGLNRMAGGQLPSRTGKTSSFVKANRDTSIPRYATKSPGKKKQVCTFARNIIHGMHKLGSLEIGPEPPGQAISTGAHSCQVACSNSVVSIPPILPFPPQGCPGRLPGAAVPPRKGMAAAGVPLVVLSRVSPIVAISSFLIILYLFMTTETSASRGRPVSSFPHTAFRMAMGLSVG